MSETMQKYMMANDVCARFGGITKMTLWRWLANEEMAFPRPNIINRRQYFLTEEIDAWEKAQLAAPEKHRSTSTPPQMVETKRPKVTAALEQVGNINAAAPGPRVIAARDELAYGDIDGFRAYLKRDRRDKRFDPVVEAAIEAKTHIDTAVVDHIVDSYAAKLMGNVAAAESQPRYNPAAIIVHMPNEIEDYLASFALGVGRTLSQEIVSRLESSIGETMTGGQQPCSRIADLEARVTALEALIEDA